MTDIDWDALREIAIDRHAERRTHRTRATRWAPPRSSTTGAPLQDAIPRTPRTASGLCAECGLVSNLAMTGGGSLVAFVCVNGDGETIMPCGRCRQLLYEHAHPNMLLETVSGIRTIDEVLPDAFGPRDLERVN